MPNKHPEGIPNKEGLEEIALCKKALKLYLDAKYEFSNREVDEEVKEAHEYDAEQHAQSLAEVTDGLRLGAPGYMHTKLVYLPPGEDGKRYFLIIPNGLDKEKFRAWQSFVAKKFRDNGLNFRDYVL